MYELGVLDSSSYTNEGSWCSPLREAAATNEEVHGRGGTVLPCGGERPGPERSVQAQRWRIPIQLCLHRPGLLDLSKLREL